MILYDENVFTNLLNPIDLNQLKLLVNINNDFIVINRLYRWTAMRCKSLLVYRNLNGKAKVYGDLTAKHLITNKKRAAKLQLF